MDLIEIEQKSKELVRDPKKSQKARVSEGLQDAFDLIGGVPRLALWANSPENQGEFYKLWARNGQTIDMVHSGEVIIRPALPLSPLDADAESVIDGNCSPLPAPDAV